MSGLDGHYVIGRSKGFGSTFDTPVHVEKGVGLIKRNDVGVLKRNEVGMIDEADGGRAGGLSIFVHLNGQALSLCHHRQQELSPMKRDCNAMNERGEQKPAPTHTSMVDR